MAQPYAEQCISNSGKTASRWLLTALCLAVTACGGGGGDSGKGGAAAGGSDRSVAGSAVKGPLHGATIRAYQHNAQGQIANPTPLAETTTDNQGNFNFGSLPGSGSALLAASGGGFFDESDPDGQRFIAWPDGVELLGFLPASASTAAITPLTDYLVQKSLRDVATGLNFNHSMAENRSLAVRALGFDPVSVIPPSPINPPAGASQAQLQYAMSLGGIAMAVNSAALQMGFPEPDFDILQAVLQDFSDCVLDGRVFGDVISVNDIPLPENINLDNEIERFRNNNFDKLGAAPRVEVDVAQCQNQLPFAADDNVNTDEDVPVTINILQNDSDPDGAFDLSTLVITSPPDHGTASINAGTGQVLYTPDPFFNGLDGFSYRLQDNLGARSNIARVTINVANVNNPPVITSTPPASATEGVIYNYNPIVQDPDGPETSWTLATGHTCGGTINAQTGAFSFTPAGPIPPPSCVLSITVNDGGEPNLTATQTATITILPVDGSPVVGAITPPPFNEDTQSIIDLPYSDPENDLATACAVSGLTNVSVTSACACPGGVCTVGVTGLTDYNGPASFNFSVTANGQTSNQAAANLSIVSVNDAPSFSITESMVQVTTGPAATEVTRPAFVTDISPGPADESTQTVSFQVTVPTEDESLFSELPAIDPAGTLSFTAAPDVLGSVNVTVQAMDDGGTANGGVDSSANQFFTIELNVPICVAPPDGMVAWFTGDAAHTPSPQTTPPTTYDIQSGRTGELINGATAGVEPGNVAEAMSFDGVNDHVLLDAPQIANLGSITVGGWIRVDTLSVAQQIFAAKTTEPMGDDIFTFKIEPNGAVRINLRSINGNLGAAFETNVKDLVPVGVLKHVMVSWDGAIPNEATPVVHVDGVAYATTRHTADGQQGPLVASTVAYLGHNPEDQNTSQTLYLDGLIDEIAVFNRPPTTPEVLDIYNAGTAGKCKTDAESTDADGDGLTLVEEAQLGTDPNNPDTDGDGVNDGDEVANGTDPLVPDNPATDTDDDGLSDAEEMALGSNPNAANSFIHVTQDGDDANNDGATWDSPLATNMGVAQRLSDIYADLAICDCVPEPVYVLYGPGTYDALTITSLDFETIMIGSLEPGSYAFAGGSPTTEFSLFDGEVTETGTALNVDNVAANFSLFNLALTEGNGAEGNPGGGARLIGSGDEPNPMVIFDNVLVEDNSSQSTGGGIHSADVDLSLLACEVRNNFSNIGGGIYALDGGLEIHDSRIVGNTATDTGGGIVFFFGNLTMTNTLVAENTATNNGGGLYLEGSNGESHTIENSIFAVNTGSNGGGISVLPISSANFNFNLRHNRILSNSATDDGAGLYVNAGSGVASLFNNLFVGNGLTPAGGGTDRGGGVYAVGNGWLFPFESNTVAYNQARNAGVGAGGGVFSTSGVDFSPSHNIVWFNDNGDLNNVQPGDNLTATFMGGRALSNNINDAAATMAGVNIVDGPADPQFVQGFYLTQAANPSVDNAGADTAANVGLTDPFTTNPNGAGDVGNVDLGYHHEAAAQMADGFVQINPAEGSNLGCGATLTLTPVLGSVPIGSGHLVVFASANSSAGFEGITSLAPAGEDSRIASDMGDGRYSITASDQAPNVTIEVYVDDLVTPVDTLSYTGGCF